MAPAREAAASTESSVPSTSPESSSDGSGDLALVAVLGVGVLVAAIVVAAVRRRGPRTFALPDSVVAQVREAHADRIEQEARDLVLELGEAVRRSDLDTDHDTGAWQAALDHYDAATRVLDGSDDLELLDAVGALVLARQARAALDAATSGKTFRPLRLCYLNPLHDGPGRTSMRLEQDGHTLDVPVCRTCRSDLKAGRDPDALRVERRGRAVLYVDSGVEPWASTAYGTLGTGLVGALHRTAVTRRVVGVTLREPSHRVSPRARWLWAAGALVQVAVVAGVLVVLERGLAARPGVVGLGAGRRRAGVVRRGHAAVALPRAPLGDHRHRRLHPDRDGGPASAGSPRCRGSRPSTTSRARSPGCSGWRRSR